MQRIDLSQSHMRNQRELRAHSHSPGGKEREKEAERETESDGKMAAKLPRICLSRII